MKFEDFNLNIDATTCVYTFNDIDVNVKYYLPIEEKASLIEEVLNVSITDERYYNPLALEINLAIGLAKYYTDIEFPETYKNTEVADKLISSGFYDKILKIIPKKEYDFIRTNIEQSIKNYYDYNNSIKAAFELLSENNEAIKALDIDKNALSELKEIMDKMG